MKKLFIPSIMLFFVAASLGVAFNNVQPSYAADASKFKPGRIIDDAVFTNHNTMTPSQIQNFLKKKLDSLSGGCDVEGNEYHNGVRRKNYSPTNPAPFTCLIYYHEDPSTKEHNYGKFVKNADGSYKKTSTGEYVPVVKTGMKSAAHIIYDVSQKHKINPQVLIVLLQKEQGLVGDDWPWEGQYRSATGYGCPDTAECDSNYYGFYNQVERAANMFREIMSQSSNRTNWYPPGNAYVRYHPNIDCGGTDIKIQNLATSALYNYTPYQPNQAALNNLYGSGDGCSAYGNRNFWRDFTDWFSNTNFPLTVKIIGDENPDKIYLVWENHFYHISSRAVLEAINLDGTKPKDISYSDLGSRTEGPSIDLLTKFDDNTNPVYLINNRNLYHFANLEVDGQQFASGAEVLSAYGLGSPHSTQVYPQSLKTFFFKLGKMALVLSPHGSDAAYHVNSSKKHWIADGDVFRTMGNPIYASQPRVHLSEGFTVRMNEGAPILKNNKILRASDMSRWYVYDQNQLYKIEHRHLSAWNLPHDYNKFSDAAIRQLPGGGSTVIQNFAQSPHGSTAKWLLENKSKRRLNTDWGVENFPVMSNEFFNRFTTGSQIDHNIIRVGVDDAIYYVKNLRLHHIATRLDFDRLGFSMGNVTGVTTATGGLMPKSSQLYGPGRLVQVNGQSAVYLVTELLTRQHIPSPALFENYGFQRSQINASSSMSGYQTTNPLTDLVIYDSKYWLIDSKLKRIVSSELLAETEYNWIERPAAPLIAIVFNAINADKDLTVYVRGTSNPNPIYRIENGQRRHYTSPAAFSSDGGTLGQVTQLSDSLLQDIPEGPPKN